MELNKFKLNDLCEFITDGTHQTPEYCDEGGVLFLSSKDVTSRKIDWNNAKHIPSELHEKLYARLKPQKNDILLAKNGTTGIAALVDRDEVFDVYVSLAVLRPKPTIYPPFLLYAVNSPVAKRQFDAGLKGIGVPNLHLGVIRETQIKVPSLDEQKRIVSTLDKIASVIDARLQQLSALDDLIKARFVEMFGDPETNPKGWDTIKLSDLCDLQNGYAFKSDDYTEYSSVLNCRMSNIRPDGGFDANYHPKYLPDEYWEKYKEYRLYDGDVIIAMTDMASDPKILGVPTIVKCNGHKMLLNQRVGKLIFSDKERINRVFLMSYLGLEFIRKNLAKQAGGSTQINVGKPAILATVVIDPPYKLQESFAEFVAQIDKSKSVIQKSLDETQLLFDSLMQKYFGYEGEEGHPNG